MIYGIGGGLACIIEVFWQRPFFSWRVTYGLGIVYIPIKYPYFYTLDIGTTS
jgi:hypothetical protein